MKAFEMIFPKACKFGRVLPKKKIYEHTTPSAKLKQLFVNQVVRITWAYKLSEATTNITADELLKEIQIFEIDQKTPELDKQILQLIDKAIPSPIIYKLKYEDKYKYAASQTRFNEKGKRELSQLFSSDWFSNNEESQKHILPQVLHFGHLYEELLKLIVPLAPKQEESVDQLIERTEKKAQLEKEIAKLKKKLGTEKQFNRQVEINKQLKSCLLELNELNHGKHERAQK